MSAADLTGGNIMDISASLLNDTAKSVYTYVAQAPYLRLALQELREFFELNSIPATQATSAVIQINAGTTTIVYNGAGTPTNPSLPDDMVEPAQLWERARGIDPYTPMSKRDYLPLSAAGVLANCFGYYVWNGQEIVVPAASQNNDIKIDYIKELFPEPGDVLDSTTQIGVVNAASFLQYRTAALCAEFIERNTTSANALNASALLAIDRANGIGVKGKQNIMTRRRPFRSAYKRGGFIT